MLLRFRRILVDEFEIRRSSSKFSSIEVLFNHYIMVSSEHLSIRAHFLPSLREKLLAALFEPVATTATTVLMKKVVRSHTKKLTGIRSSWQDHLVRSTAAPLAPLVQHGGGGGGGGGGGAGEAGLRDHTYVTSAKF